MQVSILTLNIKAMWDYFTGPYRQGKDFYLVVDDPKPVDPAVEFPYMGETFTFTTPADAQLALRLMNKAVSHATDSKQLQFLLDQAPMIDFDANFNRLNSSVTAYAYVHPKTIAPMTMYARHSKKIAPYVMFPGSPTRWVVTTLMPEGRVIYTPNQMPGIEKLLG